MRKKIKGILVPIIAILFSTILYIVSSTSFFDFFLAEIVVKEKIPLIKNIINILNFLVLVIPLGIQSVEKASQAARCEEVIANFGQSQRELISHILKEQGFIDGTSDDINIRIFTKRFNQLVLEEKMKLCAREIKGELSFSIKKREGLCVQAFLAGHSMLELKDGSRKNYNLNERQRALAGGLKFIVAVPIYSKSKQAIKRVICFDSFQEIAKNGCGESILKTCESVAYHINSILDG